MDKQIALRLPPDLLAWAQRAAKAEERSMSSMLRFMLRQYLSENHAHLSESD